MKSTHVAGVSIGGSGTLSGGVNWGELLLTWSRTAQIHAGRAPEHTAAAGKERSGAYPVRPAPLAVPVFPAAFLHRSGCRRNAQHRSAAHVLQGEVQAVGMRVDCHGMRGGRSEA